MVDNNQKLQISQDQLLRNQNFNALFKQFFEANVKNGLALFLILSHLPAPTRV